MRGGDDLRDVGRLLVRDLLGGAVDLATDGRGGGRTLVDVGVERAKGTCPRNSSAENHDRNTVLTNRNTSGRERKLVVSCSAVTSGLARSRSNSVTSASRNP